MCDPGDEISRALGGLGFKAYVYKMANPPHMMMYGIKAMFDEEVLTVELPLHNAIALHNAGVIRRHTAFHMHILAISVAREKGIVEWKNQT